MALRDENTFLNNSGIGLLAEAMDMEADARSEQQPPQDGNHFQADGEADPMLCAVEVWAEQERPVNTRKAYAGKMKEFKEYCGVYFGDEDVPTIMTFEKVFPFILYQVMRVKRPGGARKKGATSGGLEKFRVDEFVEISELCQNYVAQLMEWTRNGKVGEEPFPPETVNPSGHSTVTHYKNSLRNLHRAQQARGWDIAPWELTWTPTLSTLHLVSQKRVDRINRSQYREKRGSAAVMQYNMVEYIPRIEDEMWNNNADFKTSVTWMMNRFFFLYTTCGVIRGETIFKMQMSDLAFVQNENENDLHPVTVLMTQYSTGKTVKDNKASFGRAARNKDVRCCPVGGLAFYLAMRFTLTREFESPLFPPERFLANENWFNVKLLVDPFEVRHGEEATKNVSYDTYYKEVHKLLAYLKLPNNVVAHLGRHLGHMSLEMKEVKDTDIDKLGNWNQEKPRGRFYSTNLPITPLRQMAMDSQID